MPSTILSDNGVTSNTSGIKVAGSNDGILELQTTTAGGTATTAITIDTGQRSKFPTTIGVGGATPATSGSGISFPASASASSDANTLDDYEEGTFTPTAFGSTTAGTTTYVRQFGFYTKVGRQVTVNLNVIYSAMTGTGELNIGGLPFTSEATANDYAIATCMTLTLNWSGGTQLSSYIINNAATMRIYYSGDDILGGIQSCTNEAAEIYITMTYFTA